MEERRGEIEACAEETRSGEREVGSEKIATSRMPLL